MKQNTNKIGTFMNKHNKLIYLFVMLMYLLLVSSCNEKKESIFKETISVEPMITIDTITENLTNTSHNIKIGDRIDKINIQNDIFDRNIYDEEQIIMFSEYFLNKFELEIVLIDESYLYIRIISDYADNVYKIHHNNNLDINDYSISLEKSSNDSISAATIATATLVIEEKTFFDLGDLFLKYIDPSNRNDELGVFLYPLQIISMK